MEELEVKSVEETPISCGEKPEQLLKKFNYLDYRYQDFEIISVITGISAGVSVLASVAGFVVPKDYRDLMIAAGILGTFGFGCVSGWCYLEAKKWKPSYDNSTEACNEAIKESENLEQTLEEEQEVKRVK